MNTLLTSFGLYWPTFYYNTRAKIVQACTALISCIQNWTFLSHWGSRPNYFDFYNDDLYRVVNRNWIMCRQKTIQFGKEHEYLKMSLYDEIIYCCILFFLLDNVDVLFSAPYSIGNDLLIDQGKNAMMPSPLSRRDNLLYFFWQQ